LAAAFAPDLSHRPLASPDRRHEAALVQLNLSRDVSGLTVQGPAPMRGARTRQIDAVRNFLSDTIAAGWRIAGWNSR
jgi:hypothetical protein